MNTLKIVAIILGLLLAVSVGFAAIIQMSNMELKDNLSKTQEDLSSIQTELNQTELILQGEVEKLNNSESFTKTYLNAYGLLLISSNLTNISMSNYNLAASYYDNNNWDNAIYYYTLAKTGDDNESQQDINCANTFKNATVYTNNTIYQNLCNAYYNMMMAYYRMDSHRGVKTEYMILACQAFKNGDYTTGNDNVAKSNVELDRSNEELKNANGYLNEIINIFKQM